MEGKEEVTVKKNTVHFVVVSVLCVIFFRAIHGENILHTVIMFFLKMINLCLGKKLSVLCYAVANCEERFSIVRIGFLAGPKIINAKGVVYLFVSYSVAN